MSLSSVVCHPLKVSFQQTATRTADGWLREQGRNVQIYAMDTHDLVELPPCPPTKAAGSILGRTSAVYLDALMEKHQGVSVRSRNLRLTAIHSFFRFAAFEAPAHSAQIQRVLAIPSKRFTRCEGAR